MTNKSAETIGKDRKNTSKGGEGDLKGTNFPRRIDYSLFSSSGEYNIQGALLIWYFGTHLKFSRFFIILNFFLETIENFKTSPKLKVKENCMAWIFESNLITVVQSTRHNLLTRFLTFYKLWKVLYKTLKIIDRQLSVVNSFVVKKLKLINLTKFQKWLMYSLNSIVKMLSKSKVFRPKILRGCWYWILKFAWCRNKAIELFFWRLVAILNKDFDCWR